MGFTLLRTPEGSENQILHMVAKAAYPKANWDLSAPSTVDRFQVWDIKRRPCIAFTKRVDLALPVYLNGDSFVWSSLTIDNYIYYYGIYYLWFDFEG